MHAVTHIDWSLVDRPAPAGPTSSGLARQRLVGPEQGAVHTDLAAVALLPGGWLAPHVHALEEALYVLDGELLVDVAQRLAPDAGRKDTFYEPAHDLAAMDAAARRPPFGEPTLRWVGHYEGTGPQLETLRIRDAARGRASAGRDTALVVYSGISVKMLVDPVFGADHVTMFTVDYEVGGAAQAHDHPFEEAYVFLAGEVEGELDGQHYTFRPGDVAFAGVGSVHGFYNTGTERVRWLETQAPQPPARHSYRWVRDWERYEAAHTEDPT